MKIVWFVAVAVLLVGFAILFRPPRIDETMAPARNSKGVAPPLDSARATADRHSIDEPWVSDGRAPVAPTASVRVSEITHVSGRCVDERGEALEGVELTLASVGERWSRTESAAFTLVDEGAQSRFRAKSSSDGHFLFDVPRPDARSIELVATPDDAHLELRRTLEGVIGESDVDLGDLRCETAGRMNGLVRTAAGEPVAGVTVIALLEPQASDSVSDEHGRFTIGHLRAGSWRLQARSERFLVAEHPPVTIRAGGDPVQVDLVAELAPVLSGRIVDTEGAPIAGAVVAIDRGPSSMPDFESTFSLVDGTFELHLRSTLANDALRLKVLHAGFVLEAPFAPVEPNARDIVVVMKRAPNMTFRVVDGVSGMPITRYRIRTAPRPSGSEIGWWIEAEDHPRGEAQLDVTSEDEVVMLAAQGRARVQVPVAADEPGGKVQTLRMFAGGSIVGRLTRASQPAVGVEMDAAETATMLVVPESPAERGVGAKQGRLTLNRDPLRVWVKRDRAIQTDGDGRFRFDELSEGSWTVTVRGMGSTARSLDPVQLGIGSIVDVGDVALDAGAGIEGRVLVPDGLDPSFERITVDGNALFVNADANGKFRFEGLEAGKHVVEARFNKLLGLGALRIEVELADSEHRLLDLDLRESRLAHVHVRLVRDRRPLAQALVEIEAPAEAGEHVVGVTSDDVGEADVLAPPRVPIFVVVRNSESRVMARSAELTLEPGQHARVDLTVEPGRLEIVLPERIQERGWFTLGVSRERIEVDFSPPAPGKFQPADSKWISNQVSVGEVPPGTYTVVAYRRDEAGSNMFRFEGSARVEAGRLCVVDFSGK